MRHVRILLAVLFVVLGSGAAQAASNEAIKRNNFGAELLKQGQTEEAVAEFRRAVTVDPGYGAAYRNLGFALERQGQTDEAVAAYRKASELESEVYAHNNLGVLYDKKGLYDEAIQEFEKALKLGPSNATVLKNLEKTRKNKGIVEGRKARVAQAQKEVEARPEDPRAAYNLARVYASFDEQDQAFTWLAKALELGFDDLQFVRSDPVLAGLQKDARFAKLLERR